MELKEPKTPKPEEDTKRAIEAAAKNVNNLHREKAMFDNDVIEARKKIGDSNFDQVKAQKNLADAINRAEWIKGDILTAENELQKLGE